MKLRYKNNGAETCSSSFNIYGMSEVLTPDDSAIIREMDVWLDGIGWKDMAQAFRDKDIVPDNHNEHFGPPTDAEAKKRGWNW